MHTRRPPTMTADEYHESFRLWLGSSRARAHRVKEVRWFAQDLADGVIWLNDSDPKVTAARCRAIRAFFADPLGYRAHALLWRLAGKHRIPRYRVAKVLRAI
jgi:hypothetical protein